MTASKSAAKCLTLTIYYFAHTSAAKEYQGRTPTCRATDLVMFTERCLLVEDDERLRASLSEFLAPHVGQLEACGDARRGIELIRAFSPQLVVLDFQLGDGNAFDVLAVADTEQPAPAVLVMSGQAGPAQAFELSERGARGYVQKPVDAETLLEAIRAVLEKPPRLTPRLRAAVGIVGLKEVEALARRTMVEEALARESGSRRGAARLLRISRQLLQHAIRSLSD